LHILLNPLLGYRFQDEVVVVGIQAIRHDIDEGLICFFGGSTSKEASFFPESILKQAADRFSDIEFHEAFHETSKVVLIRENFTSLGATIVDVIILPLCKGCFSHMSPSISFGGSTSKWRK
jgi:hypothetical protein